MILSTCKFVDAHRVNQAGDSTHFRLLFAVLLIHMLVVQLGGNKAAQCGT